MLCQVSDLALVNTIIYCYLCFFKQKFAFLVGQLQFVKFLQFHGLFFYKKRSRPQNCPGKPGEKLDNNAKATGFAEKFPYGRGEAVQKNRTRRGRALRGASEIVTDRAERAVAFLCGFSIEKRIWVYYNTLIENTHFAQILPENEVRSGWIRRWRP